MTQSQAADVLQKAFMTLLSNEEDAEVDEKKAVEGEDEKSDRGDNAKGADEVAEDRNEGGVEFGRLISEKVLS